MLLVLLFCANFLRSTTAGDHFACRSNLAYDFRNINRFTDNMCAQCLWYMAGSAGPWIHYDVVSKWRVAYNYSDSVHALLCTPNCTEFTYQELLNKNNTIQTEFKSPFYLNLLLDCCEQARQCCLEMQRKGVNAEKGYCPAKWDGFMCWDSAVAGTINYKTCPGMTYSALGIRPTSCRNEIANKECLANGTWARIWKTERSSDNRWIHYSEEYTNYLPCSTPGATHRLRQIRVQIGVYILSLVLTVIGLLLLWKFPMRKQPKLGVIHVNFLFSLTFTSIFSLCVIILIKEQHYRLNSMIDKNPVWCRLVMILMKAARLTNYCWMLNEGIILWQMIVRSFPVNQINMTKFYMIGWLMPAIVMALYSCVHAIDKYNRSCWTKSMGYWELIYNVLPITFIIINVILLIHMTYILFQKLTASKTSHLRAGVRKSLVLVPIFGIQYIFYIVPFDPFESCAIHLFVFHYMMIITEALQGAIVTTIFCFFNQEVRQGIQQSLKKRAITRNSTFQNAKDQAELQELTNNCKAPNERKRS